MRLSLLLLCSVLLFSCQKEFDPSDPAARSSGGLLKNITITGGQDSATHAYVYDANRKIISITETAHTPIAGVRKYLLDRNAAGIIQNIREILVVPANGTNDTISRKANYNAAQQRYESLVVKFEVFGFVAFDSTAFTYDNAGKIVKAEHFRGDSTTVESYEKEEYQYSGQNVTQVKKYEFGTISPGYA